MENKDGDDELFDRLTVRRYNKYFFSLENIFFLLIDSRS